MKSKIRNLHVSVISDVHLATHACKAKILVRYLKSINPEILVLNGDIIDSWRFSRNYFPKPHLKVIRQFIKMLEKGVKIFYITGNHDEFLRKFNHTEIGNLKIVNQLILELDGKKTWIFHGDLFDHIIHQAKWLAKIGAATYGFLTLLNKAVNSCLRFLGFNEVTIYKSLKRKLVRDNPRLNRLENAIAKIAGLRDYQTVICGHSHIRKERKIPTNNKLVHYINCGDWVEHFTAVEYSNQQWQLFYYTDTKEEDEFPDDIEIPNKKELYKSLFQELTFVNLL